jgi:hypothetical protein
LICIVQTLRETLKKHRNLTLASPACAAWITPRCAPPARWPPRLALSSLAVAVGLGFKEEPLYRFCSGKASEERIVVKENKASVQHDSVKHAYKLLENVKVDTKLCLRQPMHMIVFSVFHYKH